MSTAIVPFMERPENDIAALLRLGETLVASGLMPRHVTKPAAAVAIILAGREMGIGPMLAIRSLSLVEGKVVVAADLQLARFKAGGGRATFTQLDETGAVLALRHPNGDEHVEAFTMKDAAAAGLTAKDNWRKYPKAMLRSRVITAGLKSIGFEPTAGAYDPDEIAVPDVPASIPRVEARVATTANAIDVSHMDEEETAPLTPLGEALLMPYPFKKDAANYGKTLADVDTGTLRKILGWIVDKQFTKPEFYAREATAIAMVLDAREPDMAHDREPGEEG